jgi:hypothetical protein
MGRTNPTYRDALDRYEASWSAYRRTLRAAHRPDFDRLFDRAAEFAAASGQQNPTDPHRTVVVSVLLSQERELRRLRERVSALEAADGDPDDGEPQAADGPRGAE